MVIGPLLVSPEGPVRALNRREAKVRERYLTIRDLGALGATTRPTAHDVLAGSAFVLECGVLVAAFSEVAERLGVRTLAGVKAHAAAFEAAVKANLGGIDPGDTAAKVQREVERSIDKGDLPAPRPKDPAALPVPVVLRLVRSILDLCPIHDLDRLGRREEGLAALGHRCRVAYDYLLSFARRNDERTGAAERTAGIAYAEGRLSVDEVASLVGGTSADALALLESHGYCRAPKTIRLRDEERAERLRRIREDRLRRGGRVEFSASAAARDALSSQRIEGVDARRWIPIES